MPQPKPHDNIYLLTLAVACLPLVAVLGIIFNILIRDGPEVPTEIGFLEFIVSIGTIINGGMGIWHTWHGGHKQVSGDKNAGSA